MDRDDLEHLIRASADVTKEYDFVILGSQAILGEVPNPAPELTMSMEADMYPRNAPEKADAIDGVIGEGSDFHDLHGYYASGVGPETAKFLPSGWEGRLCKIQNSNTDLKVGWCLSCVDLFLSKAALNRPKDRDFCIAMLRHGYVTASDAIRLVPAIANLDPDSQKTLVARIRRWDREK